MVLILIIIRHNLLSVNNSIYCLNWCYINKRPKLLIVMDKLSLIILEILLHVDRLVQRLNLLLIDLIEIDSIRIVEDQTILIIDIHLHALNLLSDKHGILLTAISNLICIIQLIIADILLLLNETIPFIEMTIFILDIVLINLLDKNWQSLLAIKFKCLLNKLFLQLFTGLKIIIFLQEILIFLFIPQTGALHFARLCVQILLLFLDFYLNALFHCVAFSAILVTVCHHDSPAS